VNVADDFVLTETYEHHTSDVPAVQDEIAARVAERFKLSSGRLAEHAASRRATDNPLAYQLYRQGRHYWSQRYQGQLRSALDAFQRAIDADAAYSLAHAGVADVFSFLGMYSFQLPREAFALASTAAQRAFEIDPGSPEVQTSLALIALGRDWNAPAAIRYIEWAVAIDHSLVVPRIYHAWTLALLGDRPAALEMATAVQEQDPRSVLIDSGVVYTLFLTKEYEAGVAGCDRILERDPDLVIAMYVKGMFCAQLGRFDEAIALLERAANSSNRAPFCVGLLGNFYARAGRIEEAQAVLVELRDRAAKARTADGLKVYVPPHAFAYAYAGLGDLDAAFEWQRRAHDDGGSPFNYFSPVIECMHADPRHRADLRSMGWRQWDDRQL
jgi:tetratricopeptide (TPR) repeat protein